MPKNAKRDKLVSQASNRAGTEEKKAQQCNELLTCLPSAGCLSHPLREGHIFCNGASSIRASHFRRRHFHERHLDKKLQKAQFSRDVDTVNSAAHGTWRASSYSFVTWRDGTLADNAELPNGVTARRLFWEEFSRLTEF